MAKTQKEMVLESLNQAIERLNGAYSATLRAARLFEPDTLIRDGIMNAANQLARTCNALVSIRDQQRVNGG